MKKNSHQIQTISYLNNSLKISEIGWFIINTIKTINDFYLLVFKTLTKTFSPPFRFKDTLRQIHCIANQSLIIIVFCVCFAAMVTIIEASYHMKLVIQNDSMVPGFASMLILRELGVVVSALLLTSRVSAGIAAEVGTMQITEQIDALKMLGIDPIRFIVVPRFVASIIGLFLISIIANIVCLFGAMVVSVLKLGYTMSSYIFSASTFIHFQDLLFASIKGACFGSVIPIFSCFYGFRCRSGAEGVGHATTKSVVSTSVCIIILDFILSWIFSHSY